jgi:arylsulfatase A-like enzyme
MDAHGPYVPPPPFASAFERTRPADPLEYDRSLYPLQYDRELSYLDAHVTRLIDGLRSRSLFHDTVVIVTSDHGEGFGSHGFWRHDLALYEELIAVPLYVKAAGDGRPGVSKRPVTSPDLFHLMLEQLGLGDAAPARDAPITAEWYQSEALTRSPVMRPDDGQPIDRDLLVWIDGGLKWIVSSRGDVKAYDLSVDPFERTPAQLSTNQIEAARARAKTWWDGNPPLPRAERPATELDPAVIDRLRNLGYVH